MGRRHLGREEDGKGRRLGTRKMCIGQWVGQAACDRVQCGDEAGNKGGVQLRDLQYQVPHSPCIHNFTEMAEGVPAIFFQVLGNTALSGISALDDGITLVVTIIICRININIYYVLWKSVT